MSLTSEPMLYEMHMHTPMCHHASGEPEDYAQIAQQRGLKGIVVTCHNPTNDGWSPTVRMSVDEFGEYVEIVEQARNGAADPVAEAVQKPVVQVESEPEPDTPETRRRRAERARERSLQRWWASDWTALAEQQEKQLAEEREEKAMDFRRGFWG